MMDGLVMGLRQNKYVLNMISNYTGSSEAHSENAFAMSSCNASQAGFVMRHRLVTEIVPPDHLLLDSAPNIGPLIP
jgi:hypothetical protein